MRTHFPPEVAEKLRFYVYRLIDPRNGETFYVGKGQGDRVFQHAAGAAKLGFQEGGLDAKIQRIKEIHSAGLEVGYVLHRHGIEKEDVAFQIEAAVIDAYPGLANRVGGHSNDFGVAHAEQLIAVYGAEQFLPAHELLLISIGTSYYEEERTVYDAVRYAWVLDPQKAKRAKFVLAHVRGLVKGAFVATEWLEATPTHFPGFPSTDRKRWGFVGEEAPERIRKQYVGKRVPDKYRTKGAANPVRYIPKEP